MRTLRSRVTALAGIAVLLVLAAASVAVVLAQRSTLTDNLDETLVQQADLVVERLRLGQAAIGTGPVSDDITVQVVDPGGAVVEASVDLAGRPPWDVPVGQAVVAVEGSGEGGSVRLVSRAAADGATVYVAGGLDDVRESTAALTASLLAVVPLSAAVLAGIVWWSVGRTLRPVEDIRARVDLITAIGLDQQVPEPATHDEIARLAQTMNAMLGRLHASVERQRRFVADASHELRSPLARMRSELEVDQAHPGSADPAATHASVLAEALTLQRLVDDLMLLARGDADSLDLAHRGPVDLDDVVQGLVRRPRTASGLTVDVTGVSPVQVLGDRSQLERAVANLLDNAVRYARTRVTIGVTETVDGGAMLTVADDGPGIPLDRREAVFERFTRLDDARRAGDGGAGLGLAISRDIAERHGGTLTLHAGSGPGARFVLVLPPNRGVHDR